FGGITLSDSQVGSDYVEFARHFKEIFGFSGTPSKTARQLSDVFGINLKTVDGPSSAKQSLDEQITSILNRHNGVNAPALLKAADGNELDQQYQQIILSNASTRRNWLIGTQGSSSDVQVNRIIQAEANVLSTGEYGMVLK